MATLYILGENLVDSEEYKEKYFTGQIDQLFHAAESNKDLAIGFRETTIHAADLMEVVPFRPIGIGRPFSVEIMTIYTGDFIVNKFLAAKKKDLLCTSGVRASQTFDATARAINMMELNVEENSYLEFSALKAGTPYVYYSKAVDAESLLVTLELDSNSFNEDLFSALGELFSKAAGIPVFMPAASYLLAGSKLLKIGSEGGNQLFESSPFISETLPIRFATAGLPTNMARRVLLCHQQYKEELMQYKIEYIDDGGGYRLRLMKDGRVYDGKAPYIIINIDGAEKPALNGFTPTLASAGILKKFYGGNKNIEDAGHVLLQAMSIYNDYTYRTRADKMEKELAGLKDRVGTDEYKRVKELYEAYLKNIQNDLLKKKV